MTQSLEVANSDLYTEVSEISKALCNGYADERWFENQYQNADFESSIETYDEFVSVIDGFAEEIEDKVMGHKAVPPLNDERQAAIIDNLELPADEFEDVVGNYDRISDGARHTMYSMDESGLLVLNRLRSPPEGWEHLQARISNPPSHRKDTAHGAAREFKDVEEGHIDGTYALSSVGECYKDLISELEDLKGH
ncbi:MAG: hypothetical protein H8Z69_01930 [Nanohaloarchaea archaeon]|nr:hypothetical protein [Candidatus Nanohaloarchaea archaeon]